MFSKREGIFETASSSVHAIVISKSDYKNSKEFLYAKEHGMLILAETGEYNRSGNINSFEDRLGYLLTSIREICKNYRSEFDTNSKYTDDINFFLDLYNEILNSNGIKSNLTLEEFELISFGYIDHGDELREFWSMIHNNHELMMQFLFGEASWIAMRGDNDDDPDEEIPLSDSNHEVFVKFN